MKFHVLGHGAVGCLIAGLISLNHQVVLLSKSHEEPVQITVDREADTLKAIVSCEKSHGKENSTSIDVIIVTTKAFHVRQALLDLRHRITANTVTVILSNGALALRQELVDLPGYLMMGCVYLGAYLVGPFHSKQTGHHGKVHLGPYIQNCPIAHVLETLAKVDGLNVVLEASMVDILWTKTVVNSVINPLTAILKCKNGELLLTEPRISLMKQLCKEAYQVSSKYSRLSYDQLYEACKQTAEKTAENKSSTLQDVLHSRKTEIDYINGFLTSLQPLPTHTTIIQLIHALEPPLHS